MTQPEFIKSGDKVVIVAPAGRVEEQQMKIATSILSDWGLIVEWGNSLNTRSHNFAGEDNARLGDLQTALDSPVIKAIFCARGGYGVTRIIDRIDLSKFMQYPKWVIGFSDITALHCLINRMKVVSVHAIMPNSFGKPGTDNALQSLHDLLIGESVNMMWATHEFNKPGKVEGVIVGGNLSLLVNQIGTFTELDTNGAILMLEDTGEYGYHIDRMVVQLKRAGKFNELRGMIIGKFPNTKEGNDKFELSPYEIINCHVKEYNFPICYDIPIGHVPDNIAIPLSREVRLSIGDVVNISY